MVEISRFLYGSSNELRKIVTSSTLLYCKTIDFELFIRDRRETAFPTYCICRKCRLTNINVSADPMISENLLYKQ